MSSPQTNQAAIQSTIALSKGVAQHLLGEEDIARANWYGWFAAIWLSAPSAQQMSVWQASPLSNEHAPSDLEQAWAELIVAANKLSAEQIDQEYTRIFISVGKPEVLPQASFHLAGFLHERPLVNIRARLAELGLAINDDDAWPSSLTEDHLGLLCTTMRELVMMNSPAQKAFFHDFVASWSDDLVATIQMSANAQFYKYVADLWQAFVAVEQQAFDFE